MSRMKHKKQLGIAMLIIGIISVLFAARLNSQVAEGQMRVANAEQQEKHPPRLRPVRDEIARESNSDLSQKIHNAIEKMSENQQLATWFQIGGVVLIVLGASALLSRKK